ncbi:hypothetical protein CCR85_06260 [Rhodothalassium salexigens]|uniref:hypothetical protein n=1 Tax=Rhodothalassium salexigens TaxID=1086 RepID=UPI0019117394|nr:hypothetical protein [Rhodothalassium salexigens]MBK5911094.1 hypothetical protein [Rhodothalassium salexigens]
MVQFRRRSTPPSLPLGGWRAARLVLPLLMMTATLLALDAWVVGWVSAGLDDPRRARRVLLASALGLGVLAWTVDRRPRASWLALSGGIALFFAGLKVAGFARPWLDVGLALGLAAFVGLGSVTVLRLVIGRGD